MWWNFMSFTLSFAPLGLYPGSIPGSHFTLHFYFFNVFPPFHYHLLWNFLSSTQTKPNLQFLVFAHPLQKKDVYIYILCKNFNVRCMGFYVHTYHSRAITWFFAQTFLQSYNSIYIFTRFQSSHLTCIKKKWIIHVILDSMLT